MKDECETLLLFRYSTILVSPSTILPSEEIYQERLFELTAEFTATKLWDYPIVVDIETSLVMDGNHRLALALSQNFDFVPVVMLGYSDSRVNVQYYDESETNFPVETIKKIVATGDLLPPKSTRHIFTPPISRVDISLDLLMQSIG